jgi:outer membrane protein assembly factor BamB
MTRTRTTALPALLLSAAVALSACGGAEAPSTPAADSTAAAAPVEEVAKVTSWESDVNPAGDVVPVLLDGVVVAVEVGQQEAGGDFLQLAAVEVATGDRLWRTPAPLPPGGEWDTGPFDGVVLTTAGDAVLASYVGKTETTGLQQGGSTRYVVALDPRSGKQLWLEESPGELIGGGDVALFLDDVLVALEPRTGKQLWQAGEDLTGAHLTGGAVVATRNSALVAFEATTGKQLWSSPPAPVGVTPSVTHTWSVMAADGGSLVAELDAQTIYGHSISFSFLDAMTGAVAGTTEGDGGTTDFAKATVSPDGTSAYIIFPSEVLLAFNAAGGWRVELPELSSSWSGVREEQSFRTVGNDKLVIDSEGYVTLDPATGQQVGEVVQPGDEVEEPLFVVDGWEVREEGSVLVGKKSEG